MKPKPIAIDLIRIDAGTQFRAAINQDRVADYADLFDASKEWPFDSACEVFFDGVEYYLVDGFHRYHAAVRVKRSSLSCVVHSGTMRDAIKFSLSANSRHGLHRSNEDKRKAVLFALNDSEWSKLSSGAIAEICGVSDKFVGNIRKESGPNGSDLIGKDGKKYPAPKPKPDAKPAPKQKDEPEPNAGVNIDDQPVQHYKTPEPDVWEDVYDEPEAKPEPTIKERVSGLKSIVKQHNAAMMRAIDDMNGIAPNATLHSAMHLAFRTIHESNEAWK